MTTLTKILLGAGAALLLILGVGKCRDSNATVANAVAKERVRVIDSMTVVKQAAIDSQRREVKVRVDTVRRFSTRWDTVTAPGRIDTILTPTGPAVPLPQYEAVVAAGDSLKRSCTLLAQTCEALSDSVPKLVQLYRNASAARDSLIRHPPPARRWSLCGSAGYGVVLGSPVRTGPTASLGLCYRVW